MKYNGWNDNKSSASGVGGQPPYGSPGKGDVEELMKPRYKLEIRYPHYPFDGDILLVNENGELYHEQEGYCQSIYKITESEAKESKCFRLMNWFEDREADQMPQYVKIKHSCCIVDVNFNEGVVCRLDEIPKSFGIINLLVFAFFVLVLHKLNAYAEKIHFPALGHYCDLPAFVQNHSPP